MGFTGAPAKAVPAALRAQPAPEAAKPAPPAQNPQAPGDFSTAPPPKAAPSPATRAILTRLKVGETAYWRVLVLKHGYGEDSHCCRHF